MLYLQIKDKELELLVIESKEKKNIVKQILRFPLPPQLIVNGFIQDEDLFLSHVSDIVEKENLKKHKTILTIDSTFLVYRELTTPHLRKKQLDAFIYHNLKSQINSIEEYTIDYAILNKDKNLQVLAIAAPNNLLEAYQHLLKKAGLILKRITTSPLNLIRGYEMTDRSLMLPSQIYVYYNGEIINSVLFNHGNYVFANAYRTFGSNTPEVNIMERVSQLMQFQKAQTSGIQVERVNIYGNIDLQSFPMMSETLNTNVVSDESFDILVNDTNATLYQSMSSVFASLPNKQRNYNLMSGINQNHFKPRSNESKSMSIVAILLLINVIVVASLGGYLFYMNYQEKSRKSDLQSQLENPMMLSKYRKALELSSMNALYDAQVKESQLVEESLRDLRAFDYELYQYVLYLKPVDVSWSSLSYQGDMLTLSVSAKNRTSTYIFVKNLRESDLFLDVSYQGFSYNENTKTYNYQVNIKLKVGDSE